MSPGHMGDDELLARLRDRDPSTLQEGKARAAYLPSAAQLRAASELEHGTSRRSGFGWWKAAVPIAALSVAIGAWAVVPSLWPGGQVDVDAAGTSGSEDVSSVASPIEPTKTTVELGGVVVGVANLRPPEGTYVKFTQHDVGGPAPGSSRDRYWPASGADVYSVHYGGTPSGSGDTSAPAVAEDVTYLMVQSPGQALGEGAVALRDVVETTSASEVTAEKVAALRADFAKSTANGSSQGSFARALDDLLTFGLGEAQQRATWLALLAAGPTATVSDGQLNGKEVVAVEYQVSDIKGETATNKVLVDSLTGVVVARRHQGSVDTGYGANSDIFITGAAEVPAYILDAYATAQSDGRCSTEAGFPVCRFSGMKKT